MAVQLPLMILLQLEVILGERLMVNVEIVGYFKLFSICAFVSNPLIDAIIVLYVVKEYRKNWKLLCVSSENQRQIDIETRVSPIK